MKNSLVIIEPDDFHVHFRSDARLDIVLPHTANNFARALAMPNLKNPVLTAARAVEYKAQLDATMQKLGIENFEPLFTIQITDETTPEMVYEARKAGVIAGKVYPKGKTHNSHNGVSDFKALFPVFQAMQECNMVCCIHGEDPQDRTFCLDREIVFLTTLYEIAKNFPSLKIVLEHITTGAAVYAVKELPKTVAATITVHHMFITLDDVVGGQLNPHYFCKPLAKRPEDRHALVNAAITSKGKFFFGSDSAPHMRTEKECASGCAGVYTSPVALPMLAEVFERNSALKNLEAFTSKFGADFYELPHNTGSISLDRRGWDVPAEYSGIVPFMAGQRINWQAYKQ